MCTQNFAVGTLVAYKLTTSETVVVRVNDRVPYQGREFDVSEAVFENWTTRARTC
jgi:rare lipoprotein A (peptidoglycan hydrolase)